MGKLDDKQRINAMYQDGKLSKEERDRLVSSIERQEVRENEFSKQTKVRRSTAQRKMYLWLFSVFVVFVFGLLAGRGIDGPLENSLEEKVINNSDFQETKDTRRPIALDKLNSERSTTMTKASFFSATLFIMTILVLTGIWIFWMFNRLVDDREMVNSSWAQVENVYQRRLDLVPVLVDSVKTYMEHEKETLNAVTEARAKAEGASLALAGEAPKNAAALGAVTKAQDGMASALSKLIARVESYPDLKANQNFLALQDQLEGTENRIAVERRNYNEAARLYNTRTMRFPSQIVASMFSFEEKPYFQAEKEALKAVATPFGSN